MTHSFRLADDHSSRYLLAHGPFWHDWWASVKGQRLTRWGDGDSFIVNYVGHPLQGAISGYIQIQNDPRGRALKIGRSSEYWKSRLKATAWAAVFSAQLEAGPILSEAAIGNVGGFTYWPGCSALPCPQPPTNGSGLVDWVISPVIGLGWILVEDSMEKYLVDRLAGSNPKFRYKVLLGALNPARTMANVLQGKLPWYRYSPDGEPFKPAQKTPLPNTTMPENTGDAWEIGFHYSNVNLPMDWEGCLGCRVHNSGFGVNFGRRISRRFGFDSEANFLPGAGGDGEKGQAIQGLFGLKYGFRKRKWGMFAKMRPGFVHYEKARPELDRQVLGSLTRFALDFGTIIEYYPSRHSALRLDTGTTLVRYLRGATDPQTTLYPLYTITPKYFVTQSNLQLGVGYIFRF